MKAQKILRTAGVVATAAAMVFGFSSVASASDPATVYVSHGHGGGHSCEHPDATTVQKGVDMVRPGGTVVVCSGTYKESVSITKRLTLQGRDGAVVDATGQSFGIGIGADWVTVTGMTVHNAGNGLVPPDQAQATCGTGPTNPRCAGITTFAVGPRGPVPGNHLSVVDNVLTGNLGFGLDVVSTHDSLFKNNKANANGAVGFNVVDDLGIPVRDNKIVGNQANNNRSGCGIALASHVGAGVVDNWVQGNAANGNGLAAGGAGVLLATPVDGGIVRGNQLVGNWLSGNGHAGVEVHIHVPTAQAGGNRIVGNTVGRNNSLGDFGDPKTTGIYLGSNSPMSIVVGNNRIHDDFYGIFKAGPHVSAQLWGNTYDDVVHRLASIPTFG